jgi:hypothetical protein
MNEFDSTKYKNDFAKEKYDRLNIQVPKGQKAVIEEHWRAKGYKSLNSYVNDLIKKDMDSAGAGKQISIKDSTGVIIGDNGTINL